VQRDSSDFVNEERNLFQVGFMGMIGLKRKAWRLVCEKLNEEGGPEHLLKELKAKLEGEIRDLAEQALSKLSYLKSATKGKEA